MINFISLKISRPTIWLIAHSRPCCTSLAVWVHYPEDTSTGRVSTDSTALSSDLHMHARLHTSLCTIIIIIIKYFNYVIIFWDRISPCSSVCLVWNSIHKPCLPETLRDLLHLLPKCWAKRCVQPYLAIIFKNKIGLYVLLRIPLIFINMYRYVGIYTYILKI